MWVVPSHARSVSLTSSDRSAGPTIRSDPETRRRERAFLIDNLLVRIHFIIEMIWWPGLAPSEFESPFPGSRVSTFLAVAPPSGCT